LAGLYQCIAINGVGSPATATIQLSISCEYQFKHSVSKIRNADNILGLRYHARHSTDTLQSVNAAANTTRVKHVF
jgi:hypothetical protein